MSFVRLERGNDWGVEYFAMPGKSKSAYGTCDIKLGLKFDSGQVVRVRWPDGSESEERIVFDRCYTTVHDMGHSSDVSYDLPGIYHTARGMSAWVPLDAVEVDL